MAKLLHLGLQKTCMAFRPATDKNYTSMFRLFIAFTIFIKWNNFNLSTMIILVYLQFLETNNISASAMANHLSAIKAKLSLSGIPVHMCEDPRIKYFQRAMTIHRPFKVHLEKIIDIETLQLLVLTCDSTYMGQLFKAVYTLVFFSFLRLSNLVPHISHNFSPLYHLARGDIFVAHPGMQVLIKWCKTMQTRNVVKCLKITSLGANPICPVTAVKNLLAITPGANNDPLFQYKTTSGWVPFTETQVRRHFNLILKRLNLPMSNLTFHAFRHSGATYDFNLNVVLQHIQSHGTWTSKCVWRYITLDHNASDQVSLAFKKHLYVPTTS